MDEKNEKWAKVRNEEWSDCGDEESRVFQNGILKTSGLKWLLCKLINTNFSAVTSA